VWLASRSGVLRVLRSASSGTSGLAIWPGQKLCIC
jgi:hypothetical protein